MKPHYTNTKNSDTCTAHPFKNDVAHRQVPSTAVSLRILAENLLSPMATRHRKIPAWRQKLGVAEVSCDLYALHQRQEAHKRPNLLAKWLTASRHSLLLYAPPDYKREGLAKRLHSLLGEQEDVTVVGWALEEGNNHTKRPRAGLAAKITPPCPGGPTLPTGCHMQKGGSVFVDV